MTSNRTSEQELRADDASWVVTIHAPIHNTIHETEHDENMVYFISASSSRGWKIKRGFGEVKKSDLTGERDFLATIRRNKIFTIKK